MEIQIRPFKNNSYPLLGFLLKGKDVSSWLSILQVIQLDLSETKVYPIPGFQPNSVWGCFVYSSRWGDDLNLPMVIRCQSINNKLFIPELSILYPQISDSELSSFFAENNFVYHPEFGFCELTSSIDWGSILNFSNPLTVEIYQPLLPPACPSIIKRLEIRSLPADELLENFERKSFPKQKSLKEGRLKLFEKIKYNLLKPLIGKKNSNSNSGSGEAFWAKPIAQLINTLFPKGNKVFDLLLQDFEELEKRNKSEVDKLFDLFSKNPDEALKYAIPLDSNGTNRGSNSYGYRLNILWSSLNLFSNNERSTSGSVLFPDDSFNKLQNQYHTAASKFIEEKKYDKAAFIYMKLLKNHYKAAEILEEGRMFPEAASVFLKYCNNKERAANCFEKGRRISDAIFLYKELNMNEKVGDLYFSQNNLNEARYNYQLVADDYLAKKQYVKAALILRMKMNDNISAQNYLLEGWRQQNDGVNCLNLYFKNIADVNVLSHEIDVIYKNETNRVNKVEFLKVLKHEFKKNEILAKQTKNIAYEIVSELAENKPNVLNELYGFVNDVQLDKDIVRFKTRNLY